MSPDNLTLPREAFAKIDKTVDDLFYAQPRMAMHIDEQAVAGITKLYGDLLPEDGVILDLMSSWVSHLPSTFRGTVVGHGMNAEELAANPRLDEYFVQNLNALQKLPLQSNDFDAALCCVGVQYLQHPHEVFTEVARALRPDAPFIVSFSNRCFPTKAVAVWRSLDTVGHSELVTLYLHNAGFRNIKSYVLCDGSSSEVASSVSSCQLRGVVVI